MNKCKFVIFKEAGWWHAQLCASNGKVLFRTTKHAKRSNAVHAINTIRQLILSDPIITFSDKGEPDE